MHVGKFHAAIDAIDCEFRDKKILEVLNAVIAQLAASAASPTTPDQAKLFRDQYQQLRLLLDESELNNVHPTRRAIFDEIDASKFLGRGLLVTIEHAVSANNLSPSLAVQELQKVHADVTAFQQVIASISKGFTALNVEYDGLEPNEGELGISIPRELVGADFASFVKELKQYSIAFNAFNEVVTDNAEPLNVRVISSSDWQFYLLAAPFVLEVLSRTLKEIAEILRKLVDIKTNLKDLMDKGVPEHATIPLKEYGEEFLEKKLTELADKIIAENYKKDDDGRRNELSNHLTQSLKFITHRIDLGVKVDIMICPPEKPTVDAETPEGAQAIKQYEEKKALAEEVNRRTLFIAEFSEQKGEPLRLPASELGDNK
jgi:hypothetical protein